MIALLVAVGAALGAPARFLVDRWVTDRTAAVTGVGAFPWGLLTVNAVGSAVAGVAVATTAGAIRAVLLTGFCGAFTTFSGFGWESTRLWANERRAFWWAVVGMPIACTAAFLGAWRLAAVLPG